MKIKKVYLGTQQIYPDGEPAPVYPLESIVTKQKADSSGNIYIPYGDTNWKVSIDDTVVQTGGTTKSFSGYAANSEHIVTIEPITVSYGRAKKYRWYYNSSSRTGYQSVIEIIQDKSYIGFADSETSTGAEFRSYEYNGCSNLINAAEEYLPDTVTTIGQKFRYRQYYACSKITEAPVEVSPDTVTYIGDYYRNEQFYNCTSLTNIKGWKDSSYGRSNYRLDQFYGCTSQKTVKVLSDVGYASADRGTLPNTYVSEVQVPTAYLSNFTSSTKQPRSNITDSKFVGY